MGLARCVCFLYKLKMFACMHTGFFGHGISMYIYTQVFCPAFYVVYDHQEKAIVVAIRGSMTVKVGKNYVLSYINLHHNARVNCFYYSRLLFT